MAPRACDVVLRAVSAAALCQDYRPFDERFGYLYNSYYVAAGPRQARPQRGLITRPTAAEVAAYRSHVDAAVAELIETAQGFRAAHSDHRDRAQSRATASGIVAHRYSARFFLQRDTSGLRSGLAMAAARRKAPPKRRSPAFIRSDTKARASASTTSGRRIRSCWRRCGCRRRWSPTANGWNSWRTAAIRRRPYGCRTA